jgi:hypothetical protein
MSSRFLQPTPLLDFRDRAIQELVRTEGWAGRTEIERIGAIYAYVRDRIAFGYNVSDDLPASRVLADGYGQCNTKTTLLMALLRAVGVMCRFHGATIHKRLQKGVVSGLWYLLAPRDIFHSWAEVWFNGRWTALEGVILDRRYLDGLRLSLPEGTTSVVGFGVGIDDIREPPIDWKGTDTFIQIRGVNRDLGVFDDPDAFYAQHGRNLSGVRSLLFESLIRHIMNRRVAGIRSRCMLGPLDFSHAQAQPRETTQ